MLGPQALQSGSYNRPGYLRLDFAWPTGLNQAVRSDVEEAANRAIRSDLNVSATYMPLAKAREIVRVTQNSLEWATPVLFLASDDSAMCTANNYMVEAGSI